MYAVNNNDLPNGFKMTELGPLPEEWRVTRLGDTVRTVKGKKPDNLLETLEKDCVPYLTAEYFRTLCPSKFVKPQTDVSCVTVSENDVVFIWDGSNAGDVFTGLNGVLASTMVKILPQESNLDSKYLFFFMKTKFDQFNSATTGSTIPHVSKQLFQNMTIPLPPLPEQRAIAHVLSTIQRAMEAQDKIIAAAWELKKSLMRYLFTYGPVSLSQLDQAPLKETEIGPIPEHWEVVRLGEICDIKGGRRLPKGHAFASQPTGHPYIRVVDFKGNTIDMSDLRFLTEEDFQSIKRYTISPEDVYISIAGTIGLVGTVPRELDGANLTENAAKLVIGDKGMLFKSFLVSALSTDRGRQQINQQTSKTSQPKLALARIRQISIPFPIFPEQQEIACILSAVNKKIEAEENRKASLQTLFKTMLHLLMTGQLRVKYLEV